MEIYINPERKEWENLCKRGGVENSEIEGRVREIMESVRREGDGAIMRLSKEIDGVELEGIKVTPDEIATACECIPAELKEAIGIAKRNIAKFHEAQLPVGIKVETQSGVECYQRIVPIQKVGLYIPGGTAPLFSTVLMLAIPAKIAGCKKVILCTPTDKEGKIAPEVLYAANECGVDEIYKAGGAQAVAAMGYGTESIPKVDKIFGPGNRYVTLAKQIISGENTAIDMPAGPSEVMILADSSARGEFVAADMLSQAEHGADSQAMAICNDKSLAQYIEREVKRQSAMLERGGYIEESLKKSRIIVFESNSDMIDFANMYGAEHLIISMENGWDVVGKITAAGSIFLGNYSPESAGDYASGTNHTLPTGGWAHSCSGVNIESFIRRITIQEISEDGIRGLAKAIIPMAQGEGLEAHANAVRIRLGNL